MPYSKKKKIQRGRRLSNKNDKEINDTVRRVLLSYFSTSQFNANLPGNPVREWQEDDISRPLTF